MQTFNADLAIIGAGGAGLRAAIAAAEANPQLKIALISKVYPMRSHTVAAEGGSAAVTQDHDTFDYHFNDTVAGGDWLCEQDVVDHLVHQCPREMTQLEQWGCPWSRKPDGSVNVRRFGGMKIERTWFAADKTGFHMLHTLFQTSLQFPQIQRFDEHFVLDILVDDGQARGLVAMNMMEGTLVQIRANAVVMATGGAGRGAAADRPTKSGSGRRHRPGAETCHARDAGSRRHVIPSGSRVSGGVPHSGRIVPRACSVPFLALRSARSNDPGPPADCAMKRTVDGMSTGFLNATFTS